MKLAGISSLLIISTSLNLYKRWLEMNSKMDVPWDSQEIVPILNGFFFKRVQRLKELAYKIDEVSSRFGSKNLKDDFSYRKWSMQVLQWYWDRAMSIRIRGPDKSSNQGSSWIVRIHRHWWYNGILEESVRMRKSRVESYFQTSKKNISKMQSSSDASLS